MNSEAGANTLITLRRLILGDEAIKTLILGLENMPDRVKEARNNLVEAEHTLRMHKINSLEQAKEAVEQLKLEAEFEVSQSENGDGKKKYTNAEQRKAAARLSLATSPEYIEANNRLLVALRIEAEGETHVARLRNIMFGVIDDFKTKCVLAELISGISREQVFVPDGLLSPKLGTTLNDSQQEVPRV